MVKNPANESILVESSVNTRLSKHTGMTSQILELPEGIGLVWVNRHKFAHNCEGLDDIPKKVSTNSPPLKKNEKLRKHSRCTSYFETIE